MKQFKWKISCGTCLGCKEKKKKFKVAISDMDWNGMTSDRIASKYCISVDFGISDVEIQ